MDRVDRFDILLMAIILASLASLPVVLRPLPDVAAGKGGNERVIAARSRLLFIQTTFRPVEEAVAAGRLEEGRLRLEELFRTYPDEPYGLLLEGRILALRGALPEALRAYADAVRRDGSLIDRRGLFSARTEIEGVVARTERTLSPDEKRRTPSLGYLRSRLAGGCE